MSTIEDAVAFVNPTAVSIGLSQMFTVTADSSDPAWLVLTVLDRNEYTQGATGATGSLSGNGNTLNVSSVGGDDRSTGIVFTYQASSGLYYNSTYGYFDQLTYNSSGSLDDVTNLSLFGTTSLSDANAYATDTPYMIAADFWGYLGSATVATEPGSSGSVPAQATPDLIASVAESFVGTAWNTDGCWVLASTISAEAGVSLPAASTLIGYTGIPNGEWIVAFNGPNGQTGDWQSMVKAGEIIAIGTPGGGGHITTCVFGSGITAMLVDNRELYSSDGQPANLANDGSGSDILVPAPYLASEEWAGVAASSVVIYELDTPVVSTTAPSASLATLASQSLAPLFTVKDPASKAITEWQVYDTAASDTVVLNGTNVSAHSAATALTAASLSSVSLLAGSTAANDTLEVRASNGSYWGDWQSLSVAVRASGTPASPPEPGTQTPAQSWADGEAVTLTLPADTFSNALGLTMNFAAFDVNGQPVTSWLHFNPAEDEFYGDVPANLNGTIGLEVIATTPQHTMALDLFSVTIESGSAHVVAPAIAVSAGLGSGVTPVTMLGLTALHS